MTDKEIKSIFGLKQKKETKVEKPDTKPEAVLDNGNVYLPELGAEVDPNKVIKPFVFLPTNTECTNHRLYQVIEPYNYALDFAMRDYCCYIDMGVANYPVVIANEFKDLCMTQLNIIMNNGFMSYLADFVIDKNALFDDTFYRMNPFFVDDTLIKTITRTFVTDSEVLKDLSYFVASIAELKAYYGTAITGWFYDTINKAFATQNVNVKEMYKFICKMIGTNDKADEERYTSICYTAMMDLMNQSVAMALEAVETVAVHCIYKSIDVNKMYVKKLQEINQKESDE